MGNVDISQQWADLGPAGTNHRRAPTLQVAVFSSEPRRSLLNGHRRAERKARSKWLTKSRRLGRIVEATGHQVSETEWPSITSEPYMRRRDPDCSVIGDAKPTDKQSYQNRFGKPFEPVRNETFEWLKTQDLVVFCVHSRRVRSAKTGHGAMLIAPKNAGFLSSADWADLQEMLPPESGARELSCACGSLRRAAVPGTRIFRRQASGRALSEQPGA